MPEVKILEEVCKGCGLCCDNVCPVDILTLSPDRINSSGYHPVDVTDMKKCIGCGYCFKMCPEPAIEVYK
jgi:2-oxoglutarate ferredoxin oxidoreductase subunit delta